MTFSVFKTQEVFLWKARVRVTMFGNAVWRCSRSKPVFVGSLRTPLILGCEFGCKDAVEVLLRAGADMKAVDNMGHDAFHYARLSNNPELMAVVKSHLEKATRGESERNLYGFVCDDHRRKYYHDLQWLAVFTFNLPLLSWITRLYLSWWDYKHVLHIFADKEAAKIGQWKRQVIQLDAVHSHEKQASLYITLLYYTAYSCVI